MEKKEADLVLWQNLIKDDNSCAALFLFSQIVNRIFDIKPKVPTRSFNQLHHLFDPVGWQPSQV